MSAIVGELFGANGPERLADARHFLMSADAGREQMQDLMQDANLVFAEYLQKYTAASVSLLGRWPAFIEEKDRYAETLEPGHLEPFMIDPKMTDELKALRIQGYKPSSRRGGSSATSSAEALGTGNAAADMTIGQLKLQLDKMSAKLREANHAKQKAVDELTSKSRVLDKARSDVETMEVEVKRLQTLLDASRDKQMALASELTDLYSSSSNSDEAMVRERKAKFLWQTKFEKLEKQIEPLQKENAVLRAANAEMSLATDGARQRAAEASARARELEAQQERYKREAVDKTQRANDFREKEAYKDMQLTLMADRRDELMERIEEIEAEAAERAKALAQLEAARLQAVAKADKERKLRETAESAASDAAAATAEAMRQVALFKQQSAADRAELQAQREHCAALLTQDGVREAEQRKLFDAVSELLARAQYLGEVPEHLLGMSKMEALEHRQEAIRHLRLLREAHTLSAFGPSLTLNHATMATGAAMLAAAISPRISPRDHSSPRGSKPDAKPAASPRDPSAVPGVPVTASKGRRASSAEGAVPGAAKTLPPGFGAFRAEVEASLASEAAVGGQTLGARPSPRGRQRAGDPAREPVGKLGARQSDEWEKQKLLGLMQATDL